MITEFPKDSKMGKNEATGIALKSKEEKFVLPEKWFVKPNYAQFTLVNNWAMSKSKQNYTAYMHTGNHVSYNYLGLYRNEDGCTEITYEQFMEQFMEHVYTEDVKPKSLVGRYVKALCDYPNSGKVKKNEYGLIIKELSASVDADFPSQKNYGCTKELFGKNYELMPEGFTPPTDKELLLEEAKRRYPIGTVFKVVHIPSNICEVKNHETYPVRNEKIINFYITNPVGNCEGASVYKDGKWAEIVEDYQNLLDIEEGDTIKCISENKSKFGYSAGAGWEKDLEFVVTRYDNHGLYKIYFGGKNAQGLYSDAVRLVKKKETPKLYYDTKKPLIQFEIGSWYSNPLHDQMDYGRISKVTEIKYGGTSNYYLSIHFDRIIKNNIESEHRNSQANTSYDHQMVKVNYDDIKPKPKFEVGRWYKINNCWYARFKTIHNSGNLWLFSEAIGNSGYYSKESSNILMANIPRLNPILLTDLTEIQSYLPDGHSDKIKVDVVSEYVECNEDDVFVGVWGHTKGKIYKVEDNRILTNTSKAGIYIYSILGVKCFKPSTKEAYEKQNNKQSTVMEVGKWYRLPKTNNYIVKYSSPHQCTEYIANGRYYKTGGGCNTTDAILVDVSEIQQYLPDGHVDKITKQSVHKFKIGDIVKVLKESTYFANEGSANIPSNLIIHGSYAHGSNPKAKIVNIYDKYYIVNFTDKLGKKTQLGYLEDNLVLVNPTPTMKKTGKEGKWFNHKSHGDIRYEEKIDEVLVKCYSPINGTVIVAESSLIDDSSTPEPVVEKLTVEVKTYKFPTPSYSSPSEDDELILKPFTKVKEKPKTRRYNFLVFD